MRTSKQGDEYEYRPVTAGLYLRPSTGGTVRVTTEQETKHKFPRQGDQLHKRTKVCFNYDTNHLISGTVVRDDREEPFLTIIKLDDGRYVMSTECQYSVPK